MPMPSDFFLRQKDSPTFTGFIKKPARKDQKIAFPISNNNSAFSYSVIGTASSSGISCAAYFDGKIVIAGTVTIGANTNPCVILLDALSGEVLAQRVITNSINTSRYRVSAKTNWIILNYYDNTNSCYHKLNWNLESQWFMKLADGTISVTNADETVLYTPGTTSSLLRYHTSKTYNVSDSTPITTTTTTYAVAYYASYEDYIYESYYKGTKLLGLAATASDAYNHYIDTTGGYGANFGALTIEAKSACLTQGKYLFFGATTSVPVHGVAYQADDLKNMIRFLDYKLLTCIGVDTFGYTYVYARATGDTSSAIIKLDINLNIVFAKSIDSSLALFSFMSDSRVYVYISITSRSFSLMSMDYFGRDIRKNCSIPVIDIYRTIRYTKNDVLTRPTLGTITTGSASVLRSTVSPTNNAISVFSRQ